MLHVMNSLFRAYLFLWAIIGIKSFIIKEGKGNLPDPMTITNAVNVFLSFLDNSVPDSRRSYKGPLEKVINAKLTELKPYLQDDDEIESRYLSNTEDETYNEKVPRNQEKSINDKIAKYKKIRDVISKKLISESISKKTRDLIVKTLDVLIEKMIKNNNCKEKAQRSNKADTQNTFDWNEEWKNIRKNFVNNLLEYESKLISETDNDYRQFLNHVLRLFKYITKDMGDLPKRFKIKCNAFKNMLEMDENIKSLRFDKISDCNNFRVCSLELKEFIIDLYEKVNDTAANVISNYAEMYKRDVDDNDDKESLMSTLKILKNIIEKNVLKMFTDEIEKIKLDTNKDQQANREIVSKFVRKVIDRVKEGIRKALIKEFDDASIKSVNIIKEEIRANSEMELGNLAEDQIEKTCMMFQFCNKLLHESTGKKDDFNEYTIDKTNAHFRAFDRRSVLNPTSLNTSESRSISNIPKISNTPKVTRTTLYVNATK